ncbi:MAG TPA: RidA family protein [Ignavibacteria bacterium]
MKKAIYSSETPDPLGPYSAGVSFGNLIFTSGQIALDKNGKLTEGGIKEQTNKVLENLKSLLQENGSSLDNALKATVFLKDMNDFAGMNEIFAQHFTDSKPARSTVQVSRLPKDVLVAIDLIAYKSDI